MAGERPQQTVADYVTIVLSPVLIMGLVGSLVFFLLEVFYKSEGEWRERLQWILFFFVFGAVLTARISMSGESAHRAGLYGAILALLTYLGMQSFIEYPETVRPISFAINLLLVVTVWWCTHRLTWDCTNIDEQTDMSGEGLLQVAGLEERPAAQEEGDEVALAEEEPSDWWERFQRYRERRNRKRTLGVWVVYFSLASLPIFGLGQAFIPVTATASRRFAFWLMTVYVGCGLGLLLTTCFLGLRRYLRQKRLQMPAAMTGLWLTTGGGLLLALLVVGALLPRPYAEYPLMEMFEPAGSAKRQANRVAVKGDSPAEGKGQPGEARTDGQTPGERKGEAGSVQGKGERDNSRGQGDGRDDQKRDGQGTDQKGKNQGGKQNQPRETRQGQQDKTPDSQQGGSTAPRQTNAIQQLLARLAPILKWIVFAILALVVLIALLRGGLGFLANFTDWARRLLDWWRNLFARQEREAEASEETDESQQQGPIPFSAFSNPFANGEAERLSPRELVLYSFAALEAWGRENELGRGFHETVLEFIERLGDEVPALEKEAKALGQLHGRAEYARGGLPANTVEQMRGFWEALDRVARVASPVA